MKMEMEILCCAGTKFCLYVVQSFGEMSFRAQGHQGHSAGSENQMQIYLLC